MRGYTSPCSPLHFHNGEKDVRTVDASSDCPFGMSSFWHLGGCLIPSSCGSIAPAVVGEGWI